MRRVVIITPLAEEFRALKSALDIPVQEVKNGHFTQFRGVLLSRSGEPINVDIFTQPALGRIYASALTTFICLELQFDLIIIVGTCGAIQRNGISTDRKIRLGDVIFSNSVYSTEIRKFSRDNIELDVNQWQCAAFLREAALQLQRRISIGFVPSMPDIWGLQSASSRLSMHCGATVSASSVVANTLFSDSLARIAELPSLTVPIAVEMEASGVIAAASIFGQEKKVAMLRGVSDFADDEKNDDGRTIACRHAAIASLEYIRMVL